MTGWNFKQLQSEWVGYDFDSIVGHEEGLSDERLEELERKAAQIPWVTLLRSTGGKGIHLYLFFDKPFPTHNHTEHAAIARSLLSVLTVEIGFNFTTSVDTCGSILWCYHRRMAWTGRRCSQSSARHMEAANNRLVRHYQGCQSHRSSAAK